MSQQKVELFKDTKSTLLLSDSPCQDLSVAGKGRGLEGERSGLFYQATRLIRELKPDIFIFENVKGLFSSKAGEDFKTVLQEIADIGLYDCQWQLVNTRWVLPQNRERIFFIGCLRGSERSGRKIFPITENGRWLDERENKFSRQISTEETGNCFSGCTKWHVLIIMF